MSPRKHAVADYRGYPTNGCVSALLIAALIWLIILSFVIYWISKG